MYSTASLQSSNPFSSTCMGRNKSPLLVTSKSSIPASVSTDSMTLWTSTLSVSVSAFASSTNSLGVIIFSLVQIGVAAPP